MDVPFQNLRTQHTNLKQKILPLWEEILDTSRFVGGKFVTTCEAQFAELCQARHCVLVNSGTDALRFILLAMGLDPGDEVITVPNTFIATTEAITQAGGTVVFVDIDPLTYNMDPEKIAAAITPRTRGIVPVHLFGQPADMETIQSLVDEHGLWVIEDACQAHMAEFKGKRTGSLGSAGAFSFYPNKNLGACGEAGAITTDSEYIAQKCYRLRDHGQARKYYHEIEGYNSRCDALQAAVLSVKLEHLPEWTRLRQRHARQYIETLSDVSQLTLPHTTDDVTHVYHLFVVQVDDRDRVSRQLNEMGVGTAFHYPIPLHLLQAYTHLELDKNAYPVAEAFAGRLLSLPMYPELTEKQIDYVCDCLKTIVQGC